MLPSHFPTRFGPFELVGLLGKGGMARVYDGFRLGAHGIRTRVAVKCLIAEDASDDEAVQMFVEEARLNSQLRHANLIAIHDFNKVDNVHYIAMEFVDGCDLKDLVDLLNSRGQRLPNSIVIDIFQQLLVGLDYAHSAVDNSGSPLSLVHRDLKPANIFITRQGMVKIGDFGVAKTAINTVKTTTGMVKGTPAYLSPEQCRAQKVTPASDIFSTGLILYEMLSGHRYFQQESLVALIMAIGSIDTSLGYKDIPPEAEPFIALMDSLLQQSAEARPQTAQQALTELAEVRHQIKGGQTFRAYLNDLWPAIDAKKMINYGPSTLTEDPGLATVQAKAGTLPTGAPQHSGQSSEPRQPGFQDVPAATFEPKEAKAVPSPTPKIPMATSHLNALDEEEKQQKKTPLLLSGVLAVLVAVGGYAAVNSGESQTSVVNPKANIINKAAPATTKAPEVTPKPAVTGMSEGTLGIDSPEDGGGKSGSDETAESDEKTQRAGTGNDEAGVNKTAESDPSAIAKGSNNPGVSSANSVKPPTSTPKATKPSQNTNKTVAMASKAGGTAKLLLATIPNDGRVSVDGGAPQPIPYKSSLPAGSHEITYYCQGYSETITVQLEDGDDVRRVWECSKNRLFMPSGR